MKLLYLYNEIRFQSSRLLPDFFCERGFEPDFYWTSQDEFPERLSGYNAIYLSGSVANPDDSYPWIPRLEDLLRNAAERGMPILGSCFGSQILATSLCGKDQIFRRDYCELGYSDIRLHHTDPDDPLIKGLGPSLRMFVWHNIQVKSEHEDMVILGDNEICSNHIWRHKRFPAWGIQGHPELSKAQAKILFRRFHRYFEKDGMPTSELIKIAEDNPKRLSLFENFVAYCKERGHK